MKPHRSCCKCEKPFYASYKGKYYCTIHLEQRLAEEKRPPSNTSLNKKLE